MNNAVNAVESVHACYCSCSGLSVNLMVHSHAIVDFLAHGFTEDDLRCVLLHLKRENARMNGASYSTEARVTQQKHHIPSFEEHPRDSDCGGVERDVRGARGGA